MKIRLIIAVITIAAIPVVFESCTGCGSDQNYATKRRDEPAENNEGQTMHETRRPTVDHTGVKTRIKMRKENGVYMIAVRINGAEMDFIFDTGASSISISNLEATFLYKQGKFRKEDIIGTQEFQDATGTISEGAVIILREVTIGNRTVYNVRATVVNNDNAPLLLGQSVLQSFGKISIDYNKLEITFE